MLKHKKRRCCVKTLTSAPVLQSEACCAVLAAAKRTADHARVSLAAGSDATVASVKFDPFDSCCSKSRVEQKRVRLQLRLRWSLDRGPTWLSTDAHGYFGTNNECFVVLNWAFCYIFYFPIGLDCMRIKGFCRVSVAGGCLEGAGCGVLNFLEIQVWTRRTKNTT